MRRGHFIRLGFILGAAACFWTAVLPSAADAACTDAAAFTISSGNFNAFASTGTMPTLAITGSTGTVTIQGNLTSSTCTVRIDGDSKVLNIGDSV